MFRHRPLYYYVNTANLTVFSISDNEDLVYKFILGLIYIVLIYCVKTCCFIYVNTVHLTVFSFEIMRI